MRIREKILINSIERIENRLNDDMENAAVS